MFKFKIDNQIYLKLFNKNEADELFKLIDSNREHLKKWLPWVENVKEPSDSEDFINKSREQFAENNGFQAGIWFKNKLVGVIGYHNIDWDNKRTSIGYWLSKKYVGEGIITRCCKALVDNAFENYELNKVEISCAEGNVRSRSISERLGFVQEGTVREAEWLYDHFVTHIQYGMLAEEWKELS